ncbi:hypothetical protein ACW2AE_00360 [Limosilactobacillus fermentum]
MFDQDEIIAKIKEVKPKVVAIVHGETSTGRLQTIDRLGARRKRSGRFLSGRRGGFLYGSAR